MQIISKKEYDLVDCLEEVSNNYLKRIRGINGLSNLIEKLILQLREIDQAYKDALFSHWGDIEIEYAVMLSKNRIKLNKHEEEIVNDAASKIVKICRKIKNNYKYEEDSLSWPYSDDVW